MNDFHFLRPYYFFLLIPIGVLIFFLIKRKRQSEVWTKMCDKELIPYILDQKNQTSFLPYIWMFATLLLLVVAMAGPAWQQVAYPLIKTQSGVVIALDLSPSMNAEDIKPSRLQRAIYKINDLLKERKEGQTALIVFSADPFVATPLTDDVETIKVLLPALETRIMPSEGHNVYLAIEKASDLLSQGGVKNGHILLITSELTQTDLDQSLDIALKKGHHVSVLAVGSEAPTPIPSAAGGLKKNSSGALMMTTLAKSHLSELTQSTQGLYQGLTTDDSDLHALSKVFSASHQRDRSVQEGLQQNKWLDQGYLLVLLALPFVSLVFRRGILSLLLLFLPHALQADLWHTNDQQGAALFDRGNYQEAEALFETKEWKAAAIYKLGDYERASQAFQSDQSANGLYNYANAKAKLGDLKGALTAYEEALAKDPAHEDALFNKKMIEDYLKEQEKQQDNQKKEDNHDQSSDQDTEQSQDQHKHSDKNPDNSRDKNQNERKKKKAEEGGEGNPQDQQKEEPSQEEKGDSQEEKEERKGNQKSQENKADSGDGKDEAFSKNEEELKDLTKHHRDQIEQEIRDGQDKEIKEKSKASAQEQLSEDDPQRQVDAMWLQRVKDDPAGLLRRKFLQQYQQQHKFKNGHSK
ncbi:MAG: VWA domain-containing protein [Parachlamydiaceae bacterium]